MDVTLLYFDGCPNWTLARERIQDALRRARLDPGSLTCREVSTPQDASALDFRGSPTVLIDGCDPFGGETAPAGLACRLYRTPAGPQGAPTVDELLAVLTR